jgi:hypothetical protein
MTENLIKLRNSTPYSTLKTSNNKEKLEVNNKYNLDGPKEGTLVQLPVDSEGFSGSGSSFSSRGAEAITSAASATTVSGSSLTS